MINNVTSFVYEGEAYEVRVDTSCRAMAQYNALRGIGRAAADIDYTEAFTISINGDHPSNFEDDVQWIAAEAASGFLVTKTQLSYNVLSGPRELGESSPQGSPPPEKTEAST